MPDLKPERQGFPYRRYIVARKKSKEITENAGRGEKNQGKEREAAVVPFFLGVRGGHFSKHQDTGLPGKMEA